MVQPPTFDRAKLQTLRKKFQQHFDYPLEAIGLDGQAVFQGRERPARQPFCTLLRKSPGACTHCHAEHRRAMDWAFRTGEPYFFVCHMGLLNACIPVANGSQQLGALLSGKLLPEAPGPEVQEEFRARLRERNVRATNLAAALRAHGHAPGNLFQQAVHSLFALAREVLALDMRELDEHRAQSQQQAQIAETIHAIKRSSKTSHIPYPYEREKELIEKVRLGDRYGAKGVLNELLGVVLFHNSSNTMILKARMVELLAVLSRAVAEAGVEVDNVLARNMVYFRQLLNAESENELCLVIARALNDFLDSACVNRDAQTETPVTAVVRFVERNFDQDLSVEALAAHVHLSPSRLAHLFQEHSGTTMMDTVARVRLEHAKRLLLETNLSCTEIAFRTGYADQSYFTRVFRLREKVTPRQFRVINRQSPRL